MITIVSKSNLKYTLTSTDPDYDLYVETWDKEPTDNATNDSYKYYNNGVKEDGSVDDSHNLTGPFTGFGSYFELESEMNNSKFTLKYELVKSVTTKIPEFTYICAGNDCPKYVYKSMLNEIIEPADCEPFSPISYYPFPVTIEPGKCISVNPGFFVYSKSSYTVKTWKFTNDYKLQTVKEYQNPIVMVDRSADKYTIHGSSTERITIQFAAIEGFDEETGLILVTTQKNGKIENPFIKPEFESGHNLQQLNLISKTAHNIKYSSSIEAQSINVIYWSKAPTSTSDDKYQEFMSFSDENRENQTIKNAKDFSISGLSASFSIKSDDKTAKYTVSYEAAKSVSADSSDDLPEFTVTLDSKKLIALKDEVFPPPTQNPPTSKPPTQKPPTSKPPNSNPSDTTPNNQNNGSPSKLSGGAIAGIIIAVLIIIAVIAVAVWFFVFKKKDDATERQADAV